MNKKSVTDVDVKGKRVLVRCDFNVPMKDGKITDENRIIGALPTVKYLMEHGAKVADKERKSTPHKSLHQFHKRKTKESLAVEAGAENGGGGPPRSGARRRDRRIYRKGEEERRRQTDAQTCRRAPQRTSGR